MADPKILDRISKGNLKDLSHADLSGADLSGAHLGKADLSYANLSKANLIGADLSNADLSGANVSNIKYDKATKFPKGFPKTMETRDKYMIRVQELAGMRPSRPTLEEGKNKGELSMVERLTIAGAPLELIAEVSSEPVQRALERMKDAKKRGGTDRMIKDTEQRAKATSDTEKLQGILTAIEMEIVADEEGMTPVQVHALRKIQELIKQEKLTAENQAKEKVKALVAKAKRIADDLKVYQGYSGRGMFGSKSSAAFTTSITPSSPEGKKIIRLGFTVDNYGWDYIYYTTW